MLSSYSVAFGFCAFLCREAARRGGESMKKLKEILGSDAFQKVMIGLCVIVMGISLVSIIHSARAMMAIDREISEAKAAAAAATPTPAPTPEPTPVPTPTPTPKPVQEDYTPPADLAEQKAINAHVIAMIDIPGTDTRYPILLHPSEDNYYLDITIDGDYGYPGSIYVNSMEGSNFDTFNTVIYGHNMRDGSYFGNLKEYHDRAYLDSHREIDIYTPSEKRVYDIFGAIIYDDRYITEKYKDDNPADCEAFLASLKNGNPENILLDDIPVTADSHILTLSTCTGDDSTRFLILAVERTGDNAAET